MARRRIAAALPFLALAAAAVLTLAGGCAVGPASVSGRASFVYRTTSNPFPPAANPTAGTNDYLYVRVVDAAGTGAVLLTNEASPFLIPDLASGLPTSTAGVFLDTFLFTLDDATIAGATMPVQIEAYLYDSLVVAPIDPSTDPERYTVYVDPASSSMATYFTRMDINAGDQKGGVALVLEIPIP